MRMRTVGAPFQVEKEVCKGYTAERLVTSWVSSVRPDLHRIHMFTRLRSWNWLLSTIPGSSLVLTTDRVL